MPKSFSNVEVETNSSVPFHSNDIQLEEQSLILESLSNSELCLETEVRLALLIKCFQAMQKDSERLGIVEMDHVFRANAKIVLKLVQIETMRDITNAMLNKHITFEESFMKIQKKKDHIIWCNFSRMCLFLLNMDSSESKGHSKILIWL